MSLCGLFHGRIRPHRSQRDTTAGSSAARNARMSMLRSYAERVAAQPGAVFTVHSNRLASSLQRLQNLREWWHPQVRGSVAKFLCRQRSDSRDVGTFDDVFSLVDDEKLRDRPVATGMLLNDDVLVVCADGEDSWLDNFPRASTMSYESFTSSGRSIQINAYRPSRHTTPESKSAQAGSPAIVKRTMVSWTSRAMESACRLNHV